MQNNVSSKNRRRFAKKLDGGRKKGQMDGFRTSEGLIEMFKSQNRLSLRRCTTHEQKTPEQTIGKGISYISHVC